MKNMKDILRLLAIYSLISFSRSDRTEQPLIFNADTLEYYSDWQSATENSGPYAVACPAYLDREIQFNQDGSLDHKSLFIRRYSEQESEYICGFKCYESYKLAAVVHTDPISKEKFVEFGYEVYNDRTDVKKTFKCSDFQQFSPLSPPSSIVQRGINFVKNLRADNFPYVEEQDSDDVIDYPVKSELDFIWLSRIVMKYDFSTWNVESLTYFITRDARDMLAVCSNHDLGVQFYGKNNLYAYYAAANQKNVFEKVTLPENLLKEGGECQAQRSCVAPYTLLQPYQFQTSRMKAISCSDLVKIPVWYETAEKPLDYLEKFLVTVAEVTNQRLKIIVGTHQTLKFPSKKGNKPREMYLHKKMIPIPKIVYKIVKYKSHECDPEKQLCWFDLVIVIHNQPEVKEEDMICDDKSQDWGWGSIQFMSTTNKNADEKSKIIYVCELDVEMQMKLNYKNDTPIKETLKLNHFPHFNADKNAIEFENWQEKFENRMHGSFEYNQAMDFDRLET